MQHERNACNITGLASTIQTFEGRGTVDPEELDRLIGRAPGEDAPTEKIIPFLCDRGYDIVSIDSFDSSLLERDGVNYLAKMYEVNDPEHCMWEPDDFYATATEEWIADLVNRDNSYRQMMSERATYKEVRKTPDIDDIYTLLKNDYLVWVVFGIGGDIENHRVMVFNAQSDNGDVNLRIFTPPSSKGYDFHCLPTDIFKSAWIPQEGIYGIKKT